VSLTHDSQVQTALDSTFPPPEQPPAVGVYALPVVAMLDWRKWSFFTIAIGRLSAKNGVHDCNPATSSNVPIERANFAQLLSVNPNYFGNAPGSGLDPVFPLADDTTYEELKCVGFNSLLNQLSATIEVKLPYGFGGDLCTNGSYEYVRFFVDYGGGWSDVGYVSVNTHDIANDTDCKGVPILPLQYTLSLAFIPASKNCSSPVLPDIRAILSWDQLPPSDPNFHPTWGNHVDQHVQSALNNPSTSALRKTAVHYAGDSIAENTCSRPQEGDPFKGRARDRSGVSPLTSDQNPLGGDAHLMAGDTSFEELTCVGLDYGLNSLVATFKIKRPEGFNTDPCYNGSVEYVSFWADWNNTCNYTFLGTQKTTVYNFNELPADGLSYTVIMPVDTSSASSFCNKTRIARVVAALSWQTPPPEPPALPAYGNFIETHIQLQPYVTPPGAAGNIEVVGDVFISQIDTAGSGLTLPGSHFAFELTPTDRTLNNRQSPFGGQIRMNSLSDPPPNTVYRILARSAPFDPSDSGTPLAEPVAVAYLDGTIGVNKASPDLWFDYLPRDLNFWGDLVSWRPSDGPWQFRLETGTEVGHNHIGYSPWYNIFISNESPTGNLLFTSDSTCNEIYVGQELTGVFYATMESPEFFDMYSISIIPSGIPKSIVPSSGTSVVPPGPAPANDPITPWTLDTSDATACGYVIWLYARALTVRDSSASSVFDMSLFRGFCLRSGIEDELKH
jgi:hypothetical protein